MKKLTTLILILAFVIAVFSATTPTHAAIGNVGTGTDAIGVYYQMEWIDGNWSEFYSIGGSYWAVWIDEGGTGAAGNETGNYYTYANLLDGTTTAYHYETFMNGLDICEDVLSNSATGFYNREYEYDDQTGTAGAYMENIEVYTDPLTGESENYYEKWVDVDGDGFFGNWFGDSNGDWYYRSWDEYCPGEAYGEVGHELHNFIDNSREYNSREYNTVTGWYDIDIDFYLDTDDDGNWYDNYYTTYEDSYNPGDGYYVTQNTIYDYDGVFHAAAYFYDNRSSENKLTGALHMYTDARFDANDDGSWEDYGSNQGAYRDYTQQEYNPGNGNTYSNSELWDTINHTYTKVDDYGNCNGNGNWTKTYQFAQDTDADGVIETGGDSSGGDDFWNYNQTSYNAWTGQTTTQNWTSDDYFNNRNNYWYTEVHNWSNLAGSYDNSSEAANLGGFAGIYTGYDGNEGVRWEETENTTWGDSHTWSDKEWWDAGAWEFCNGTDFDTDGNTAWNNNQWDYEIFTETWEESDAGWYVVGYEVQDYDNNNYFYGEEGTSANLAYKEYETDTGWNWTVGKRNEVELFFTPGSAAPYAGVSEWWYDTPAPNAYEQYVYSGSANAWYMTYYN